ncbi:MAG: glutamine--tRNA ligase, partial [Syntrophaceae bacterium]|nr:glutamine--tRNA ligase [Syntrophaceae bacterium]
FQEDPPGKYKRLAPGREVRLRNAYVIKYERMVKDEKTGEVVELHCTYDPETRNAPPADGRKIKGVIHWLSARHAVPAEVRLYDRLFQVPNPAAGDDDFTGFLNPASLETLKSCFVEPALRDAATGSRYQFERLGYFCVDPNDSSPGEPVFNRVVALRDTWAKISDKG